MKSKIEFDGFQWDRGNREKCRRHGVSREEVESLFRLSPGIYDDPDHSQQEPRLRAIGRADTGRHVFAAFSVREVEERVLIRHKRPLHAREGGAAL